MIRTSASSQSVSTATLQSPYTPYPHYQMQSAVCSASIRYFEISKHKSLSMSTAMFSWVVLRQLVWLVMWEIFIGQSRCQLVLLLLCFARPAARKRGLVPIFWPLRLCLYQPPLWSLPASSNAPSLTKWNGGGNIFLPSLDSSCPTIPDRGERSRC